MAISIRILSQQEVNKYIINSDLNGNITALDIKVWNYRDTFIGIPPRGNGTDEQIGLFLDLAQDNTGESTTLKSYKEVFACHLGTYRGSGVAKTTINKNNNTCILVAFDGGYIAELKAIPSFRPVFTFVDNNYSTNLAY